MFSLIAGSGHCGTSWLAHVLDSNPNETWHHHFRGEMTGAPWQLLDLQPVDADIFHPYWRYLKGQLALGDVGDSNSWPPHLLPAVNDHFGIDRVIYLTRNGRQQLHSLMTASPMLKQDPLPMAANMKCKTLYDIMPDKPSKAYDDMNQFEKLCLMIAANDFMPDWLRGQGLTVDVYSLDVLISDVDALRELAPHLADDELKLCQKTDINRKVEGSRAKSVIWKNWTSEQRKAFKEITGGS